MRTSDGKTPSLPRDGEQRRWTLKVGDLWLLIYFKDLISIYTHTHVLSAKPISLSSVKVYLGGKGLMKGRTGI